MIDSGGSSFIAKAIASSTHSFQSYPQNKFIYELKIDSTMSDAYGDVLMGKLADMRERGIGLDNFDKLSDKDKKEFAEALVYDLKIRTTQWESAVEDLDNLGRQYRLVEEELERTAFKLQLAKIQAFNWQKSMKDQAVDNSSRSSSSDSEED